jgi:monoamine oxidase
VSTNDDAIGPRDAAQHRCGAAAAGDRWTPPRGDDIMGRMARTRLFCLLRRSYRRALGLTSVQGLGGGMGPALPRRDVLRWSSAAALAAGVGCSDDDAPPPGAGGAQVAVIGAGIAGLHCAYRLHQAGIDVTVYEASDRAGGRMFSARGMFPDGMLVELGGELIDSNHATLFALADELDLTLDDRFADEPAGFEREVYFIDGAEVPESTIVDQFTAVAPIMAAAVEAADSDDAAYEMLDNTSLDEWLVTNVPPATYPELHAVLQVAYRGEFGLENDEQSALNMLYLIDAETPDPFRIFGDSDERYHTHEGNDAFPAKLAEALGERVRLGAKLASAANAANGKIALTFADGTSAAAHHVVMALPFTLLRGVDLTGLELSADKRDIIDNLGYGTNTKIMGAFSSRVWRETHLASGSLATDLPLQQTWDTSIGQAGTSGILTNFLGGDRGLASDDGSAEDQFSAILADLDTVWPGVAAAYVAESAVRMHWPTAPHALGSYTCYRPGQWAYYGLEGQREGNVHFCGEHTSLDFQGWMEGGAETGALVAATIIEELGAQMSPQHIAVLGIKLLMPHAGYRPEGLRHPSGRRLRRRDRSRLVAALLADLRERLPTAAER